MASQITRFWDVMDKFFVRFPTTEGVAADFWPQFPVLDPRPKFYIPFHSNPHGLLGAACLQGKGQNASSILAIEDSLVNLVR